MRLRVGNDEYVALQHWTKSSIYSKHRFACCSSCFLSLRLFQITPFPTSGTVQTWKRQTKMSRAMDLSACIHYPHSYQCSSNIAQLDDGASSIASFEDVGNGRLSEAQSAREDLGFSSKIDTASGVVADIRYVLRYKRKGIVVECKSALPSKTYSTYNADHP